MLVKKGMMGPFPPLSLPLNKMKNRLYERLIVWQAAHELCKSIYKLLPGFPSDERYTLCSQMRRAAQSVPMNIVEGNARRTSKDKRKFFNISAASLEELDYQLLLCRDFEYITDERFEEFRNEVGRVSYLLRQFSKSQ